MADPISTIVGGFVSFLEFLVHQAIGILIVLLIVAVIWLKFYKPKPIDMQKELSKKYFEATEERLGFHKPKKLGLCNYPYRVEDIAKMPIHQIKYDHISDIVGVNVFGVITNIADLMTFSATAKREDYQKLIKDNKEAIKQDKFWIVFACKQKGKGLIFSQVKKTLLFLKPSQIINVDSNDDVIRVRGFGITPIGEYEIINDEMANVNRLQLLSDTVRLIDGEVTLAAWGSMADVVTEAMRANPSYRQTIAETGIKMLDKPQTTEAQV
jgi:hypothetical protein